MTGGTSEFNAVFGGNRSDGQYARLEEHGFYWTASENDSGDAPFYNFGKNGQALNRQPPGKKQITPALRTIRRLGEVSVEHIPSSVEPVQVENEPSTLSSLILVGKFDPPRTFLLFMDLSFCAGRSLHSEARP